MQYKVGLVLLLATLCMVNSTEENSQDSAPVAAKTEAPPAKPEVPTVTEAPKPNIVPTDNICKACECSEGKVDCRDKGIEKFFNEADWAGLLEKKITEVDLSGNTFTNVTPIPELPIQVLNLSRCTIETIDTAAFRDLQDMRVLDLSHNKLTSANLNPHVFEGRYSPDEYEPLQAMRTLDLSSNDLHSLNQDLFEHVPELTELVLSDNPLTIIDHVTVIAISSLSDLKVLKMRSCQLKEIPERFLHTPRDLQLLDLSDNQLKAVPRELEEAKNLLFLNLNQNPIEMIDMDSEDFPGFPVLPKLEELHMCNMDELRSIGTYALGGLQNLKILHLSNNAKLRELAPKALARVDSIGENYVWPALQELYISGNNLTQLDSRLVSRWERLTALEAEENPYVCDCTTQWMVDELVLVMDKLKANSSRVLVCKEPVEMAGKTMQQLNKPHHTLRCLDKYNHRPERDGALLLGALIGVLLAVPVVMSIMLLWRRGYFAPCGAAGPAGFSRAFYKRAQSDDFNF